jgi:hypothetical protein
MSIYNYWDSQEIALGDPSFYGIVMAAMRKADSFNSAKLIAAFPEVYDELLERYNAPGGALTDGEFDIAEERRLGARHDST